ncbi:MAG TPA: DUF6263 family protein [Candidatus Hydrogenedentes bacterium]|nr:DUF6263 family protein [Candidatus Hydrogenedentota bacterium]
MNRGVTIHTMRLVLLLVCAVLPIASALEAPTFESTSDAPVLLRYKYAKGDEFVGRIAMTMTMKMDMGGMKMEAPMEMNMEMMCKVSGVDDSGNYQLEMRIGRVAMKMEMMGTPLAYDSKTDAAPSQPQFKPLAAMVDKRMTAAMSPRGEIVTFDTAELTAGVAGVDPQAEPMIEQMNQMMKNAFIALPEEPVKAGETYEGGTVTQSVPDMGDMVLDLRYKVRAVSGDETQVLLDPLVTVTFKPKEGAVAVMDMKMEEYKGWILFDAARGNLVKSNVDSIMRMTMEQLGQKMDMVMDMNVVSEIE